MRKASRVRLFICGYVRKILLYTFLLVCIPKLPIRRNILQVMANILRPSLQKSFQDLANIYDKAFLGKQLTVNLLVSLHENTIIDVWLGPEYASASLEIFFTFTCHLKAQRFSKAKKYHLQLSYIHVMKEEPFLGIYQ